MSISGGTDNPLYDIMMACTGRCVDISFDPGTERLGYAIWPSYDRLLDNDCQPLRAPIYAGVISAAHRVTWLQRSNDIADVLHMLCRMQLRVLHVVSEFPEYFGNASGHAATARGDITKVAYMVGVLGEFAAISGAGFYPITVTEWKGQLTKEVIAKRLTRIFGDETVDRLRLRADAWDAVGIGYHFRTHPLDHRRWQLGA